VFRRRIPFLGIFLSAVMGILVSHHLPFAVEIFLSASIIALGGWVILRRAGVLFAAIALAFAAAYAMQTRDSPAMRFAEFIGPDGRNASMEGQVVGVPQVEISGKSRFEVQVREVKSNRASWCIPFAMMVDFSGSPPAPGDLIEVRGSIVPVPAARNPGEFDLQGFLARRSIHNKINVTHAGDLIILKGGSPYALQRVAESCREWMDKTLSRGIADQSLSCAVLAGIVLGDTTEIPESMGKQFRDSGTYHLFSVSGLHVGMIAVILWQLAKTISLGRREAVALIIPCLFFYALVTGWKPASIRAATMASIFLAGMLSSRQSGALNSLCAAGAGILILSTNELFNPGFQFSFMVVLAILLVAGPMQSFLRNCWEPDAFLPVELWRVGDRFRHALASRLAALVAVSFAAWLGSLPLTALYFKMISVAALLANPLAVPLAFIVMATALLALGGGLFSPWIASVFNNSNLVFTQAILGVVQFSADLPISTVSLAKPSTSLRITVFDFGRGGCAAIESGGALWFLDAGSSWNAKSTLIPWMRSVGRGVPDGIVLSHGDVAHLGGVAMLIEGENPPKVVDSIIADGSPTRRALHRSLESRGISKFICHAGDNVSIASSASLAVLHPTKLLAAGISDDKGLVVRLDAENARILFMSDAGPAVWARMASLNPEDLRADVLVLGRHLSGELPEATFFKIVSPRVLVVTAAGFPLTENIDERWEKMVEETGVEVFRQDRSGAVEITAGAEGLSVKGFVGPEGIGLRR
jgi:competence protein ComEC